MTSKLSIATHGWMGLAAAVLLIFNLLDGIFTIGWLQIGAATEANPAMEVLLSGSPLLFMAVKLALVSLCVSLLWRLKEHRTALVAMIAGAGGYSLIIAYHLSAVPSVAQHVAVL